MFPVFHFGVTSCFCDIPVDQFNIIKIPRDLYLVTRELSRYSDSALPTVNMTCLSKILEPLVSLQLYGLLEDNNAFQAQQSCFSPVHMTYCSQMYFVFSGN